MAEEIDFLNLDTDKDIYNTEHRELLSENDEINPAEEGFMKGYEEANEE